MAPRPVSRRNLLAAAGAVAAGSLLGGELVTGARGAGLAGVSVRPGATAPGLGPASGYVPDGTAGVASAFPLAAVKLLEGPMRANQSRNTNYLLFVDSDRLLRSFRLNYGLPSASRPCGGWEAPGSAVRGHSTGHLMSGLALTWASTGNQAAADKGDYLVGQLARCQARARRAGFHRGYLSAFPERIFGRLEAGLAVWSPYYMIHKIMAGLIDQHQLAGSALALEVAAGLADWVDWRTGRLSYAHMQQVLATEYGGLPESLVNLYSITGEDRYLRTAQRFYHAAVLDQLALGEDQLAGLQANTTVPKMISCVRVWEETGDRRYHDIAANFWRILTRHHTYVTGGSSNFEHWHPPGAIAAQLSNRTCENCVSYNMLKLTRLLHFHQPHRTDLLDHYERTLFNQMLGEQDPASPHGFNCYYTGLSPGAFKQQPLNYFPRGDPDVYSTDYGDFTCDHATGMETQAKYADTIYSRDPAGLYVNLFIPSEVTWAEEGITVRQVTGFPDEPGTRIEVASGTAAMTLRVRIPAWAAGPARATLNRRELPGPAAPGSWLAITRRWRAGDRLHVTLPMRLELNPAPDQPAVQAVTHGPVVLSGGYGTKAPTAMPRLDTGSLAMTQAWPMTFGARADASPVPLIPIARMHHQHYNVYWRT